MHEPVETCRLLIRPFARDDWESFGRNVLNDPRLAVFFAGETDPKAYIDARIAYQNRPRFYDFAVIEKKSGEVIGEFNAAYIRTLASADIGLVLSVPHHRKGYGKEILKAMMESLEHEEISTFYGACTKDNVSSIALMKSAGMKACDSVPAAVKKRESGGDLCFFVRKA